ncbi:WxL domain-containing protein, partial [Bacillus cereus]
QNEISDVSPLKDLTNLEILRLAQNEISDVSPLSSMEKLNLFDAKNQSIQLEEGKIGTSTPLTVLDRDSSIPNITWNAGTGTFENEQVTWQTAGENAFTWKSEDGKFTGTVKQNVPDAPGTLSLNAPDTISVGGKLNISSKDEQYKLHFEDNNKLSVQDTREVKSQWKLTATVVQPLQNSNGHVLPNAIHYRSNIDDITLNDSASPLYQSQNTDDEPFVISDVWDETGDGLFLDIKAGEARVGQYEATIQWILEDTPGNVGEEDTD